MNKQEVMAKVALTEKDTGSPEVQVEKLVIKSHGSSKAKSICGSIMQVVNMHKAGLIEKIKKELYATNGEQPAITGN